MGRQHHDLEQVYREALSLDGSQRADYIRAHSADADERDALLRRLSQEADTRTKTEIHRAAPALTTGARLGHYRIQRALGSGGMGYVYEAVDEDLNRPVALKVLPAGQYDESTRSRFRREAQSASALNHPNIVTVHEVGREGEIDFIAMERVPGRTLHSIVNGQPMPLRQAVRLAAQIADALAAAHENGIVHRDLKPSNVMVTDRDVVKVLDFGLAKRVLNDESDLSITGTIIGTTSYMSPEQAEGRPVDARSDIFGFGSVLYEMLTGQRLFRQETALDTLKAITAFEPKPLREIRPDVPPLLDSLYCKCMRKQPHDRWQSLADAKLLLQDLAAAETSGAVASGEGNSKRASRWIWAAGAGAVAVLLTLVVQRALEKSPSSAAPATLRLVTADVGLNTAPALSQDGAFLAFASDRANEGNLDIWIQQIGGGEPIRLTSDPSDETDPSFSPDGARIAFRSEKNGGGIYVIPALGGDPVLVAPRGRSPRFSPDGKVIAYWEGRQTTETSTVAGSSKVFLVDLTAGVPHALETGLMWGRYPVWSPDGDSLILWGMSQTGERRVQDWWTVPAGGGNATRVGVWDTIRPLRVRYFPFVLDWYAAADGPHVLFAPDAGDYSNLWRMTVRPDGKPLTAPVRVTNGPGRQVRASFGKTKDGLSRLAYSDEILNYDVWRLPINRASGLADAKLERVTNRFTPEMNPSISADGRQIYYITTRLGTYSLVRRELDTGRERILHSAPGPLYNSRVAPGGAKVYFSNGPADMLGIASAGGAVEKLCSKCGSVTGVAPDGGRVLFQPAENEDLLMFDVASKKTITVSERRDAHELLDVGQFSPDGKWAAFQASNNATQESAVFIVPLTGQLPVKREQWIAVTDPSELARDPVWLPESPYFYFTSERDGFRCVWATRLDPTTRRPQGDSFAVQHFHATRLGVRNRAGSGNIVSLSAGGNHLVFALTETTGNIWLEDAKLGK